MDISGQAIKGYELRQHIGSGGFGAVYRAYQAAVEREVAVKIILQQYANQPDFIRRFQAEAQVIARLEHAHIVPLYDYWREPDRAYLVMRWLRGGSLRSKLGHGPLDTQDVVRIMDQLAGALHMAHRRHIVHRDLKPDNVLVDEEDNVYLADFGLAIDVSAIPDPSEKDHISGSPAYLAPEQINGEEMTPRADIYAMGIVLYELLSGKLPFTGKSSAELLQKQLYEPIPALSISRPDLPLEVEEVVQQATAKDPQRRFPDMMSMVKALRHALSSDRPSDNREMINLIVPNTTSSTRTERPDISNSEIEPTLLGIDISNSEIEPTLLGIDISAQDVENPYMGLRAFQEADAGHFFGREALVEHLLARLREPDARFLTVIGPSGTGKSSVVKAGLVPAIRHGALPGSEQWFVAEMTPGNSPLRELGEALLAVSILPRPTLTDDLRSGNLSLVDAVAQALAPQPEAQLVLVIDQFEELFTLAEDQAERQRFLDNLFDVAANPASRVCIIITLRADFYDRPLMYPEFGELVQRSTQVVLPLARAELARAIVGPAEQVGLQLEPGLVQTMLNDLEDQPGALPLLQFALTELFERRNGRMLTLGAYQDSGGVLGALGRRAEDLYESLNVPAQQLTQQLFLRLVALGEGSEDTRRRVPRTELSTLLASRQQLEQVLDTFGRYRLLTFDRDPSTRVPTIEIAHEALIRTWQRLQTWLDTNREDLFVARRLSAAAGEWTQAQHDPSFLASGSRLDQFETWMARTSLVLNAEEKEYLTTSIAQRETQRKVEAERKAHEASLERRSRNRLRALVGVMTAATLIALALTGFAVNRQQIANDNAATATNAQGQAVAIAAVAQTNFIHSESQRLAAEANTIMQVPGGNSELAALLSVQALKLVYTPQADRALLRAATLNLARRQFIGHHNAVQSVAFSPDSSQALTASWDFTIGLWDVQTGTELNILRGHTDTVSSAVFSPDGRTVLSSSVDRTLRLWDARSGRRLRIINAKQGAVTDAVFSPDGKQIVSGGQDGTLRLWDVQTGSELRRFVGHTAPVFSVAFSPDGSQVLSGSEDGTARLWDANSGAEAHRLTGFLDTVRSVAFSPDGATVLAGSFDTTTVLWDAHTGQKLKTFTSPNPVSSVAFFSDGKSFLTGSYDGTARQWDTDSGTVRAYFTGPTTWVLGVAVSPDNHWLLIGSKDGVVRLWDIAPNAGVERLLKFPDQVENVALSPDGQQLLVSVQDNTAKLYDRQTGTLIRVLNGHSGLVTRAIFSPDGKTIYTGSIDKTIRQWDTQGGQTLRIFTGHTDWIQDLAIVPDGKQIISGSSDGTARLWDTQTGQELQRFQIPQGNGARMVFAVAFSPDGTHLLVSGSSGIVQEFDARTGQQSRQFGATRRNEPDVVPLSLLLQTTSPTIYSVAYSPDGRQVLAGDDSGHARLWDAQSGKLLLTLAGHANAVLGVRFSSDGKIISTASGDLTIGLWDAQTGARLRILAGHTNGVRIATFSPDDQWLYSASQDGTVRAWEVHYEDTVRYVCSRMVRDLTDDERSQFNIVDHDPTCLP